jgi:hypothetical protein
MDIFVRTCADAHKRRDVRCSPTEPTEASVKHFMIRYKFANGTTEAWHGEIARFITALDNDPELKGRIVYRCLKQHDDASYFHLASAADDQAVKTLQQRDLFKHYTEQTSQVAEGCDVAVTPN